MLQSNSHIWNLPEQAYLPSVFHCCTYVEACRSALQGLVNKLTDYGVPNGNILGIRYGFKGFYDKHHKPTVLTKKTVDGIQLQGGTILGTSRGGANMK